jgi:hypothetical protein
LPRALIEGCYQVRVAPAVFDMTHKARGFVDAGGRRRCWASFLAAGMAALRL